MVRQWKTPFFFGVSSCVMSIACSTRGLGRGKKNDKCKLIAWFVLLFDFEIISRLSRVALEIAGEEIVMCQEDVKRHEASSEALELPTISSIPRYPHQMLCSTFFCNFCCSLAIIVLLYKNQALISSAARYFFSHIVWVKSCMWNAATCGYHLPLCFLSTSFWQSKQSRSPSSIERADEWENRLSKLSRRTS